MPKEANLWRARTNPGRVKATLAGKCCGNCSLPTAPKPEEWQI
jgi:hypothetical protein